MGDFDFDLNPVSGTRGKSKVSARHTGNFKNDLTVKDSGCTVMYTNIDGLPNKKDELLRAVEKENPTIIALTETIPKARTDLLLAEYYIPGYDVFTNDNQKRGVAIYVKNQVNAQESTALNEHVFEESVWCTFSSKTGERVLFGCIYKSPSSTEENKLALLDLLRSQNIG